MITKHMSTKASNEIWNSAWKFVMIRAMGKWMIITYIWAHEWNVRDSWFRTEFFAELANVSLLAGKNCVNRNDKLEMVMYLYL